MRERFEQLPKQVTDEIERRQLIGELRQSVATIRDAVKSLREYPDFQCPSSAAVNKWRHALEAADLRRDAALQAISSDLILTQSGKDESAQEWKQWHREVATAVNSIVRQLETWPEGNWRWNEDTETIEPGRDLFDVAAERSTKPVPAEATEHAKLIDSVRVAVKNLRAWEDGRDVIRQPLETLLALSSEELATQWATDTVRVNHTFETPNLIATRELLKSKIL